MNAPHIYTPDIDWLEAHAEAARANGVSSLAALEQIASNSNDADARNIADAALNKIYAWRLIATIAEEF